MQTSNVPRSNVPQLTKAEKNIRKAVYAIHLCVNTLNEFYMYDYAKARRRANSVHYWSNSMAVTVIK